MKVEIYLGRALPVLSVLAALGPGLEVLKLLRARELARTIAQYGPLPEIHIPLVDYVTLTLAILLLMAAVMEVCRLRLAAPIALALTTGLWLYYIPGIWDEVTGTYWFASQLGRSTGITWQKLTYQSTSMVCAGVLTALRFRGSLRDKQPSCC